MMTQKDASKNLEVRRSWELKIVRTWRDCAYRLESRSPSSQFGRTNLVSGPESGTLLPKSLLVVGQSDSRSRALQGSRRQQVSKKWKVQGVSVGGRWGHEEAILAAGKTWKHVLPVRDRLLKWESKSLCLHFPGIQPWGTAGCTSGGLLPAPPGFSKPTKAENVCGAKKRGEAKQKTPLGPMFRKPEFF